MSMIHFENGKVTDISLSLQFEHDHDGDTSQLLKHNGYTLTLVGAVILHDHHDDVWYKGLDVLEHLQKAYSLEESVIIAWLEGTGELPFDDVHFNVDSKPFIEWTDESGNTVGDILDEFYESRQDNINVLCEFLAE